MTDIVGCPVDMCSFEGLVSEVADHIAESNDEAHTWATLGHKDAEEFRYNVHLEEGQLRQKTAQEKRDHCEFNVAVEKLEGTLYHFKRATLFAEDLSTLEKRCREVLGMIDEIETAEQVQAINDLVDRAENTIDAGDESHFNEDPDEAAQKYEKAVDALEEVLVLAKEVKPNRTQEIERQLRSVRVRQQSLELTESHRTIRDSVAVARNHAAAGNQAFQKSEYEVALKEYEKARDKYEALADSLEAFSFDESKAGSGVCDGRQRFDNDLNSWQINVGSLLQVCPSCARFGSDGNLPSPRDIAAEHRTVIENIESIRDGDVGLTWTSDKAVQLAKVEDDSSESTVRDTRQMLIQLVGLTQQLGEPPTAEELDEHTDFCYLAYRDKFGSLSDALQATGFDS